MPSDGGLLSQYDEVELIAKLFQLTSSVCLMLVADYLLLIGPADLVDDASGALC